MIRTVTRYSRQLPGFDDKKYDDIVSSSHGHGVKTHSNNLKLKSRLISCSILYMGHHIGKRAKVNWPI